MTEIVTVQVPEQRIGDDVVELSVRAFHDTWRSMSLACRGGMYDEQDGVVRARTQFPVAPFNGVLSARRDVSVDAVLDAVDEFAAADLPWNLQLRPGYSAALDAELADRGLQHTEDIPFMVLTDATTVQRVVADADVRVRECITFADVDSMLSLLERGFGMPTELSRQLFPMRMMFLDGSSTWLVAEGSEDVSTALASVVDGSCGIFNVATPEGHRGKGFGSIATAQAVAQALAAGASRAYLQSSPMGRAVYAGLGFSTVELWRQWMLPAYIR